jgi:chromosome partitioning protein
VVSVKAILVANPKGGSGKTTLSTNIAGYLASRGQRVALLDLDRQKSATQWLATRPRHLPAIELMHAEGDRDAPVDTLVIDSPAGLHGKNLDHALKLVHRVIVPIAPSAFDIQASRDFLDVLHHEKSVRKGKVFIGVVGMRMDPRTRAALTLEQFLKGLDLPVLAYLREAQVYVNAAFEGKTLFDLPPSLAQRELEQWAFLLNWLEQAGDDES